MSYETSAQRIEAAYEPARRVIPVVHEQLPPEVLDVQKRVGESIANLQHVPLNPDNAGPSNPAKYKEVAEQYAKSEEVLAGRQAYRAEVAQQRDYVRNRRLRNAGIGLGVIGAVGASIGFAYTSTTESSLGGKPIDTSKDKKEFILQQNTARAVDARSLGAQIKSGKVTLPTQSPTK